MLGEQDWPMFEIIAQLFGPRLSRIRVLQTFDELLYAIRVTCVAKYVSSV